MTTSTRQCPKCGRTVPEASECVHCGVVFAKVHAEPPPGVPRTGSFQVQPERVAPPTRRLEPILAFGVLAVVALFAALQWAEGRAAEIELPPVPVTNTRPQNQPKPAISPPAEPVSRVTPSLPASRPSLARPAVPDPVVEAPEEPEVRWVDPDSTWYKDAGGFERGFERARRRNQAVLVYFHTDWCGYCRQLESELLDRAVVQEYTKYLVKIKINPEKGDRELALANRYGVRGYPSVFVHPAGPGGAKKVRRTGMKDGRRGILSPREYVAVLTATTGEQFGAS